MLDIYDDHSTTGQHQPPPQETGQMHAMSGVQTGMGSTAGGEPTTQAGQGQQRQQAQQRGLSAATSTAETNPIQRFVAESSWTYDDLALALSALSIVAWVATTLHVARRT